MNKILLIAISQIGIAIIGSILRLKYPGTDWGIGLFTGFFIGSASAFYTLLDNIKKHRVKDVSNG